MNTIVSIIQRFFIDTLVMIFDSFCDWIQQKRDANSIFFRHGCLTSLDTYPPGIYCSFKYLINN